MPTDPTYDMPATHALRSANEWRHRARTDYRTVYRNLPLRNRISWIKYCYQQARQWMDVYKRQLAKDPKPFQALRDCA